jgi:uncharacterized protein YqeY
MSGLAERLTADMKDAMRDKDAVRLGAIRNARAAIKNAEIEARTPLDDAGITKVLRSLVKQHRESIEQFTAGGRDDLVAKEQAEMAVLEAYLPAQMDEAAVAAVVAEVIAAEGAAGPADLGRVMKAAMTRLAGQADGGVVRTVAQRLLEG